MIRLEDVKKAREIVSPFIRKTELSWSNAFSKRLGAKIFLKFENEQRTGSFKIRGALNKLHTLTNEERKKGVIASSAGNHAQGVAFAATQLGVQSLVVMPESAPLVKIKATEGYGAKVILKGEIYDEAYEYAHTLSKKEGYIFVHPYDDPFVMAGQGTLGLEILEQLPDVDALVVPIGGGGLISGVATAVKALNPKCKIIGVQAKKINGMVKLFHKESPSHDFIGSTIADGIAVKNPSHEIFNQYISRLVDDLIVGTDEEIAEAIVYLLERVKSVVEGAGAIGLAAALSGRIKLGNSTCFLLSGGNIDMNIVSKIIEKGLCHRGRLAKLSVVVEDLPGQLHRLTSVLASKKANILQIYHDRVGEGLYLRETQIDFLIETVGHDHIESIRHALMAAGARIL